MFRDGSASHVHQKTTVINLQYVLFQENQANFIEKIINFMTCLLRELEQWTVSSSSVPVLSIGYLGSAIYPNISPTMSKHLGTHSKNVARMTL